MRTSSNARSGARIEAFEAAGPAGLLTDEACYRALSSRDARFDGKFFTAVRTTGIYCRPVCPARTPKRTSVRFYACAAAAEAHGYRPCLRCRPETSPGTPAWFGTSATVSRALRLIDAGALDAGSVDELAARLGTGARHLRRLFLEKLGAAPLAIAQTRRVQLAKQLIDETSLPLTRIAFDAGFSSVRRFNAAIKRTFKKSPSALRREPGAGDDGALTLRLAYRPPYDAAGIFSFLATRATPGVDAVADGVYRRTVESGGRLGTITVRPHPSADCLILEVPPVLESALGAIVERVRTVFDLRADPVEIRRGLEADPDLASRMRTRPGLRVAGAWNAFELAVRGIVGQQISVAGATTLMGRIAERWGAPLDAASAGLSHLFPTPDALAEADVESVGMPRSRAATVRRLAAAIAAGELRLEAARGADDVMERLTSIAGIGPWTAGYITMRALGEPDAYPAGDLGLCRALARADGSYATPRELARRAESWRPWRAYASFYLWTVPAPVSTRARRQPRAATS